MKELISKWEVELKELQKFKKKTITQFSNSNNKQEKNDMTCLFSNINGRMEILKKSISDVKALLEDN